jgi:hypothetical protein
VCLVVICFVVLVRMVCPGCHVAYRALTFAWAWCVFGRKHPIGRFLFLPAYFGCFGISSGFGVIAFDCF